MADITAVVLIFALYLSCRSTFPHYIAHAHFSIASPHKVMWHHWSGSPACARHLTCLATDLSCQTTCGGRKRESKRVLVIVGYVCWSITTKQNWSSDSSEWCFVKHHLWKFWNVNIYMYIQWKEENTDVYYTSLNCWKSLYSPPPCISFEAYYENVTLKWTNRMLIADLFLDSCFIQISTSLQCAHIQWVQWTLKTLTMTLTGRIAEKKKFL